MNNGFLEVFKFFGQNDIHLAPCFRSPLLHLQNTCTCCSYDEQPNCLVRPFSFFADNEHLILPRCTQQTKWEKKTHHSNKGVAYITCHMRLSVWLLICANFRIPQMLVTSLHVIFSSSTHHAYKSLAFYCLRNCPHYTNTNRCWQQTFSFDPRFIFCKFVCDEREEKSTNLLSR